MDQQFREDILQRLTRIEVKVDKYITDYQSHCNAKRSDLSKGIRTEIKALKDRLGFHRYLIIALFSIMAALITKGVLGG
jgi:cupin superfamily acireductone dioxygenase involved in methionine salvage